MPSRGTGDALLKGRDWDHVKAHWRRLRIPHCQAERCRAPDVPIDYGPGRGPWSLDIGHIVGRDEAKALGWSRAQINSVTNTQPEHSTCNRSSGGAYGRRKHSDAHAHPTITSGVWD